MGTVKDIFSGLGMLVGGVGLMGVLFSPVIINEIEIKKNTFTLDERIAADHAAGIVEQDEEPDKFAVLVGGNMSWWMWSAQNEAYSALTGAGFPEENIYVLSEKSGIKDYRVDDITSRESLTTLFDHVGKRIGPEDALFVFFNGHGTWGIKSPTDSTRTTTAFCLPYPHHEDHIFQKDLTPLTESVNTSHKVIMFDMCCAGGLAGQARRLGWETISASTEYGNSAYSYGSAVSRNFFRAFSDTTSDTDGDGILSLDEAFNYAKKNGSELNGDKNYPFKKFSSKGATMSLGPIIRSRNNR
jgi:hypothetical protein